MALKVKKDGFVYEVVTPATRDSEEVVVRRQVFAGQLVPDHYDTSEVGAEDEAVDNRRGVFNSGYSHNPASDGIAPRVRQDSPEAQQAQEKQAVKAQPKAQPKS